jgi:ribosome assembly protein 1
MSPSIKQMSFQSTSMVRVTVEPKSYNDIDKIEKGLKLLYQYDPAVEVDSNDNDSSSGNSNNTSNISGQHTISCLGELHLEQCLKALTERFAK